MGKARSRRRTPSGLLAVTGADLGWLALMAAVIGTLVVRNHFLGLTTLSTYQLGPLTLTAFGPLVALDMLFGYYLVKRWCTRFDLDWEAISEGLIWIVGLGLVISHLTSIALYFPEDLTNLLALVDLRTRLSSFGGFYGGGLVAIIWLKRRGMPVWPYADALAYAFVGGYIFGRSGCFAIHDHPGTESDFPLAVEMGGVPRHDLGFYELLLMLALFGVLNLVGRRGRPAPGTAIAIAALIYAPVRFAFDYLRIEDATYAGLTPGQWFCFPLVGFGLWAWAHARKS